MHITFTSNRYKKYYTVPEVYMDNKICNTVVTPIKAIREPRFNGGP